MIQIAEIVCLVAFNKTIQDGKNIQVMAILHDSGLILYKWYANRLWLLGCMTFEDRV